jgi:hypothetical protein
MSGQQPQNERIEQQAKLQDDGFYYVMLAGTQVTRAGTSTTPRSYAWRQTLPYCRTVSGQKATVPPDNVIKQFG